MGYCPIRCQTPIGARGSSEVQSVGAWPLVIGAGLNHIYARSRLHRLHHAPMQSQLASVTRSCAAARMVARASQASTTARAARATSTTTTSLHTMPHTRLALHSGVTRFQATRSYTYSSSPHPSSSPAAAATAPRFDVPPPADSSESVFVRLHDYSVERPTFRHRVKHAFKRYFAARMRGIFTIVGIVGGVYAINWYMGEQFRSAAAATVTTGSNTKDGK